MKVRESILLDQGGGLPNRNTTTSFSFQWLTAQIRLPNIEPFDYKVSALPTELTRPWLSRTTRTQTVTNNRLRLSRETNPPSFQVYIIEKSGCFKHNLRFSKYIYFFISGDLNTCNISHPPTTKSTIAVYDECRRECTCQHGKLVNCYRVRKQFSELPLEERLYYINAYKTLYHHVAYHKRFLELLAIHPALKFRLLHGKQQILPFHRK